MLRCSGGIRNKIERFKRRTVILFYKCQESLAEFIALWRKQPIGNRERDRFARAAESLGFLYKIRCLHAHLFQRTLERRERGGHCARVAWKMQNPRHLRPCFAVRTSERHGQSAFDRI